jgi:hypothetical protein
MLSETLILFSLSFDLIILKNIISCDLELKKNIINQKKMKYGQEREGEIELAILL